MEERDIENYDYLAVTLKKATEDELLRCYSALGWEMIEVNEDKLYVDITHYTMRRPQQIEDKDKRLLLQVRVESEVNKMAKYAHDRHRKSVLWGTFLALFALACAACGIVLMVYFKTTLYYAVGGVIIAAGIAAGLADIFIVKRLAEWENGVFESNTRKCMARLKEVFSRISQLRGTEDG